MALHYYTDACNHYHCHRKSSCAVLDDKLEQLERLEKIRDANSRLRGLIKKVDDLSFETQLEINQATRSAAADAHNTSHHHAYRHYASSNCCGSCDSYIVHVCRLDNYCARCDKLYCCGHCCRCISNDCVHVHEEYHHHHHHHHHHVYDGNVYPLGTYPTAYYKHCESCDYCRKRYGRSKSAANRSKSQAESKEPWKGGPYETKYPWKNMKINQSHLC